MRTVYNINHNWAFLKDFGQVPSHIPENAPQVNLPHTWNAKDGQDGGNDYFRGTCCYVKQLRKDQLPQAQKYFLEVKGANSSSDVYMNGKHLAHHHGGYSTWRVEITNTLRQENILVIMVDNAPNETVYPQTADFTFYGGLYRDVNIIAVENTHFALENFGSPGIFVTPVVEGDHAKVSIQTQIVDLTEEDMVCLRILDAEGKLIAEQKGKAASGEFVIDHVHLWNGRKDPYLYTAQACIFREQKEIDKISTCFGCRSFQIHPEKGFILNGEQYPLRGVSRHQDRWGIGNALLPEHHREDMELICEMGANTIRLAHYQHDDYFYDLCDARGMVVWAEIPYISRHMQEGNSNTQSQLKELITQCYNHPSIVVWGLSNEITMDGAEDPDLIANHKVLNDMAHRLDPTRPTAIACISMCPIDAQYVHIPDVVSYNHYFGWYGGSMDQYGPWFDHFHAQYPNTPIGVSEYGCEALDWHNSDPDSGDYSEEYQALYHESLIRQLFSREYLWATHVWNMFDFGADARAEGGENGQNHKGLITFDRKYKKDAFYAYKAWLNPEPMVHLCGKRYVDRVEDVTRVTVYSNLPTVELFANGVSLGKKQAQDHFFYFDVPNRGETKLQAVAGDLRDESLIRKVDKMNPDYILREQGAVLNWFDITQIKGRFSLNDKIGQINKTVRGKLFMAGLMATIAKKMRAAGGNQHAMPDNNDNMLEMLNNFTVLRLTGMLSMMHVHFTKEELLDMNKRLNKIKKP